MKKIIKILNLDNLESDKNYYIAHSVEINKELIYKYIEIQLLLLSPICPHICEKMWQKINIKNKFIVDEKFPVPNEKIDIMLLNNFLSLFRRNKLNYIKKNSHKFRLEFNNIKKHKIKKLNKWKSKNKYKSNNDIPNDLKLPNSCYICFLNKYKNYQINTKRIKIINNIIIISIIITYFIIISFHNYVKRIL